MNSQPFDSFDRFLLTIHAATFQIVYSIYDGSRICPLKYPTKVGEYHGIPVVIFLAAWIVYELLAIHPAHIVSNFVEWYRQK